MPRARETRTKPKPLASNALVFGRHTWFFLNATVFVSAACIMTVEILSTRLVARYLGSSLYTWTSAIGVVLAGISLGNYLGGLMADRYNGRRLLTTLFILSSVACMTIPMVNGWLGMWTVLDRLSWPARIFLHFTVTFLVPATLLGTMSPVVAKMALSMGLATGRTIGTVYAWGSVGSIVGTFVAGYWLVAAVGTERAILVVAGVLAVVGVLYGGRTLLPLGWAGFYAALMFCLVSPWSWSRSLEGTLGMRDPSADDAVFEKDSQYQRVMVVNAGGSERTMILDKLTHSRIDLEDPLHLQYEYEMVYAEVLSASAPGGSPLATLFIGGGGYVFPRYLELLHPGSYVEVAEIDPVVREAACETFGLSRATHIKFEDIDARNRVADLIRLKRAGESVPKFDFVFGDAFNDFSIPFHLTTLEFTQMLSELMTDKGVYLLNLIDILDSSRFLGTMVRTLRKVFPHVRIIAVEKPSSERNTFVIVSSKRPLDLSGIESSLRQNHGVSCSLLSPEMVENIASRAGVNLLTDDYAPVENLLTSVLKAYKREPPPIQGHLANEVFDAVQQGDHAAAVALCRKFLAERGNVPLVHYWLGSSLLALKEYDDAIAEFRSELADNPTHAGSLLAIVNAYRAKGDLAGAIREGFAAVKAAPHDATLRCALGRALTDAGREKEAEAQLREALVSRPGHIQANVDLGSLLLKRGDAAAAVPCFRTVLSLAPDYPGLAQDIGLALVQSGKAAEAVPWFERAVKLDPGKAALHNQLGRALALAGDPHSAATSFEKAVKLAPQDASYRANLGLAYEQSGRAMDAVTQYVAVLEIAPTELPVMNALARLYATNSDAGIRNGEAAVRWAERLRDLIGTDRPEVLDTLACAYAEAGRFEDAVRAGQSALAIATAAGEGDLVQELRARLTQFQTRQPWHTPNGVPQEAAHNAPGVGRTGRLAQPPLQRRETP